ncbi:MAG TPA: acylphosphatase [Chthoniobacteraceae bacterium]|jgi:acylphosphatase|nr:acylphosphatase [Chthoniobacteraceae bacterium]
MTARHLFYEGRVQGVGFRYTARRIATGFEVAGWVRNLPDGRVEMLAAGEAGELEAFLQAIRDSELASFIRNETVEPEPPPPGLRGFEIIA